MIVFEAQVPKAFSDRLKPWTFGLIPEGIVGVGSIDDFAEQYESGVAGKVVFLNYRLEGTLFAVVSQLPGNAVVKTLTSALTRGKRVGLPRKRYARGVNCCIALVCSTS